MIKPGYRLHTLAQSIQTHHDPMHHTLKFDAAALKIDEQKEKSALDMTCFIY